MSIKAPFSGSTTGNVLYDLNHHSSCIDILDSVIGRCRVPAGIWQSGDIRESTLNESKAPMDKSNTAFQCVTFYDSAAIMVLQLVTIEAPLLRKRSSINDVWMV